MYKVCGCWESTFSSTWVPWIVQVQSLCRGCVWLSQAEPASRSMIRHQPKPEKLWILPSPSCSGKHCCRNQLLYLSAQEGNTDKDQSQWTGAKSDCIISNKKIGCFGFRPFLFLYLWHCIYTISSLNLWIFAFFFILGTGLWNCVQMCLYHGVICMYCVAWAKKCAVFKALNLKHIWRVWFCTTCENQIPVKFHMLDA